MKKGIQLKHFTNSRDFADNFIHKNREKCFIFTTHAVKSYQNKHWRNEEKEYSKNGLKKLHFILRELNIELLLSDELRNFVFY
jgi:hypothetical protein